MLTVVNIALCIIWTLATTLIYYTIKMIWIGYKDEH